MKQQQQKQHTDLFFAGRARRRNQAGWTMIEILVSIAVVAGFIYWVAGRGNTLNNSASGTTEAGNVNLLHTQVKAAKTAAGYGPANADLAAALVAGKKVPAGLTVSGTSILNQWNTAYAITSSGYGFSLTDTVPSNSCTSTLQNASATGDWDSITVNGSAAQVGTINLTNAGTLCSQASNVIVFTSVT